MVGAIDDGTTTIAQRVPVFRNTLPNRAVGGSS
jgi:hypothetical protein